MLQINFKFFLSFFFFLIIALSFSSCEFNDTVKYNISNNFSETYINYSSLSLEHKVSQMFMVHDLDDNIDIYRNEGFGGIFIWKRINHSDYVDVIDMYQSDLDIPFLFSVDFEGCINPFESYYNSTSFVNISTDLDAYIEGVNHGRILSELGIGLNFAPVADLNDTIWNCRSFSPSTNYSTSSLVNNYIKGLESFGVGATVKHYPGKTLIGFDPHKSSSTINLNSKDIIPFENAMNSGVDALMVSHKIVSGTINSNGVPVVVSNLVNELKINYSGLVITDDVKMSALYDYYGDDNFDDMFIDIVLAGNDIILYSEFNTTKIIRARDIIVDAVNSGIIDSKLIDDSVLKILKYKDLNIVY